LGTRSTQGSLSLSYGDLDAGNVTQTICVK